VHAVKVQSATSCLHTLIPCRSAFPPSFLSSNLPSQFVNLIERGVHRGNSVRMSFGWPKYHVEHIINISFQTLLCRIPVCDEHLGDDRIKFGCHLGSCLPVWDFQNHSLSHQRRQRYIVADPVCRDVQPSPHSRNPISVDQTVNIETYEDSSV